MKLLMLSTLPRETKSNTLSEDPSVVHPYKLSVDPRRTKLLKEKVLPRLTKSRDDMDDARRAMPNTLQVLPRRT
jgi:hypothetical protein